MIDAVVLTHREALAFEYAAARAGVVADGGFVATVAQRYLDSKKPNPDIERLAEVSDDDAPSDVPKRCSYGDIWQLGDHRLLCGDSGDADMVARLMEGAKADLVFTSPPYAQQREYGQKIDDWFALMRGVFEAIPSHTKTQVLVNLGLVHRDGEWQPYWDGWINWMRAKGWRRFGWYVWDKVSPPPGDWDGRLAPCHEWIFHFNKKRRVFKSRACKDPNKKVSPPGLKGGDGKTVNYGGGEFVTSSMRVDDSLVRVSPRSTGTGNHPAVFPVGLPSSIFASFSQENDACYEPFSGSGTSIIAAEQMHRRCYAVDIEPTYCDIALARWEKLTGKKAVRAASGATTISDDVLPKSARK